MKFLAIFPATLCDIYGGKLVTSWSLSFYIYIVYIINFPRTNWAAPPVPLPSPPHPRSIFVKTRPPCPWKLRPPRHRLFDLQDSLYKLMLFLSQLSDFVPLRNGFYSFRAQADEDHPVDPDSYTACSCKGCRRPISRHATRNTRDRSITHILQRWVATKYSISQVQCFLLFYNIRRREATNRVSSRMIYLFSYSQDNATLSVLRVVTTNQRGPLSTYCNICKFDCCVGRAVVFVVVVRHSDAWHQQHAMRRDYRRNGEGLEHGCRCTPAALLLL